MDVSKKSPRSANRRICKVCNSKHPTTFHGYVRKKKQNDNQKSDSADTPNGVDVKCATFNTGGNVIRMCLVSVNLTYSCSGKTGKTHAFYLTAAVKEHSCRRSYYEIWG